MTGNLEHRIRTLERQLAELRLRTPTPGLGNPTVSTFLGATTVRPYQVGFPAELTGTFDVETGYPWKRLVLDYVTPEVSAPSPTETGIGAFTPDNDESLTSGQRGWMELDPGAGGYLFLPAAAGASITTGTEALPGLSVTSDFTWTTAASGVSLSAGSYWLSARVTGYADNTAPSATPTNLTAMLSARLYNQTAGTKISDGMLVVPMRNPDLYNYRAVEFTARVVLSATSEIRLQAHRTTAYDSVNGQTWGIVQILSSAAGSDPNYTTILNWLKYA